VSRWFIEPPTDDMMIWLPKDLDNQPELTAEDLQMKRAIHRSTATAPPLSGCLVLAIEEIMVALPPRVMQ
jgi:hypothetical protein